MSFIDTPAPPVTAMPYPGTVLRQGSAGTSVTYMQGRLNLAAAVYTAINTLNADGKFGSATANAVLRFQKQFSLSADGAIGPLTWSKIDQVAARAAAGTPLPVTAAYPGSLVRTGSSGDNVRFVQSYLSALPSGQGGTVLTVDGRFGSATKAAVTRFQSRRGLQADGIVGPSTWSSLVTAFNGTL